MACDEYLDGMDKLERCALAWTMWNVKLGAYPQVRRFQG